MPRSYDVIDFLSRFSTPVQRVGSGGSQSSRSTNLLGGASEFDDDIIKKAIDKYNMEQDLDIMGAAGPWDENLGNMYDPNAGVGMGFPSQQNPMGWGASMGGSSMGPVSTNWLGQGMGGGASQGWAGGGMAQGGPVQGGQSYTVGEEGPETLVMPHNQSGTIIPNPSTMANMTPNISFNDGLQNFWNELFGGQGIAQDDFIKQPPLMPRDSNIGGITPVPTPPNPYEGTFDAFQAGSPRRPQNPWAR